MAASTVKSGSGVRPRKPGTKQTLTVPYELKWPPLMTGDNRAILDAIRREFPPSLCQKKSGKHEATPGCDDTKSTEEELARREQRSCLVIGINEVTRALEKGQLSLALVCKTVKPAVLVSHLLVLSASRSTPICAVHGLSDTLAPILGIKKVGACGFKKNGPTSHFEPLVDSIKTKTPEISVPWLKLWGNEQKEGSVEFQVDCSEKSCSHETSTSKRFSTEYTGGNNKMDDSTPTQRTGHKNKQRCSEQKLSSKRVRLEDTAVKYHAPNVKTLRIEAKKNRKT